MTILLCDAGGTHVRFALVEDGKTLSEPQKLKIADFPDFGSVVTHFLFSQHSRPEDIRIFRLSFAGQNPWEITEKECAEILPHASFRKINDFEANAWGIAVADDSRFLRLNAPQGKCSAGASKCVIGSGTGLGLAYICDTGHGSFVQRTHGGHMLPVTLTPDHQKIFEEVQSFKKTPSVMIYEDILSGPGIWNLYKLFSKNTHTHDDTYRDTNDMIARGRNDPLVGQTLRLYHEVLGVFAHQAVAFGFSYEGLYLTGGITDRLVGNNLFDFETFDRFFKQDNVPIVCADVAATPVYWVKDEFIALKGLLEAKT